MNLEVIQAEVELLAQECSFLFDKSLPDDQIQWQHSACCPTKAGVNGCACNAGIMTRKQMETFDTKLKECVSSENDDHSIHLKVSNIDAMCTIGTVRLQIGKQDWECRKT